MHLRAIIAKKGRPGCSFVRRSSTTVDSFLKSSSIAPNDEFVNAFVCKDVNALHSKALREGSRPLRGKLIGVKDNICTSKWPTTCSSRMLESFVPPFDATVVSLLEQAGGIVVGKTNCDEFGMGSLNTHTIHGPVINPYKPSTSRGEERSAGGSSGGSAAAVSAGMCHIALGTDTGGSIRLPASYCRVVGFKPSYGIVSRWGVISYADSLDCVGVMAREVDTVQEAFDILNVHDERDPTSVSTELRRAARKIGRESSGDWWETALCTGSGSERLKGLRVGVPQEYFPREITPSITRAVRVILRTLQQNGATIVPISLPSTKYALSAYYVLASAEASSNLARYDGIRYGRRAELPANTDRKQTSKVYAYSRSEGFGSEVKKRILLGTYALKADAYDNYFLQAQRVRQLVRNDFNRIFKYPNLNLSKDDKLSESKDGDIDVLIHPSAIRTAPLLSTLSSPRGVSMTGSLDSYVQDVLTVPASLAGLPALSVPMSMPEPDLSSGPGEVEEDVGDGWPVGVSIVGQWGCDDVVLRVGKVVQDLAI